MPQPTQERLITLLLELLAMPCVTGEEEPIADWVAARYADREPVTRVGRSLVIGGESDGRPEVLLVSHLDVVPPTSTDRQPSRDGRRIVGRGASDMKSGLAVAMDCFEDEGLRGGAYATRLVCYAGEEGPHEGNELPGLLAEVPSLTRAALAVVLEPTDLEAQLGCLGGLHAEVLFTGRAAHSARPWQGENALTGAGAFLQELYVRPADEVIVDGLTYTEVVTATGAWTENARNVVPDRFTINLNYRFAPDKDLPAAEEALRAMVADGTDGVELTIVDCAPPAPPRRAAPLVAAFAEATGAPVTAKQAWTDVARFAELGVPALNFGPGLTAQAHQAGEWVPAANLEAAREALGRFLVAG